MASINILDIISSSYVKQKAFVADYPLSINFDKPMSKTFLDAIKNATTRLSDVNCADNIVNNSIHSVGDLFEDNFKIKDIVRNIGNIGDFSIVDSKITSFICHTINSYNKSLISIIEPILKFLLVILRKIDKLKTKVQKALLDFSKQLRDCFIRIVLDAKFGLEKIVRHSIDFNGLLSAMEQCPCIMELIQEKFTKCKNLKTAQDVISCLQNEYLLSPNQLLDQMNEWTKSTITDNIHNGFNIIDESIRNILESIVMPFRALVKEYCKQLNKKYNVDFLLSRDPSIRCLFVYTKEFDNSGKEYFGMSIIDMLNTMKKWSLCIDATCSTLSDDLKRKIKEYNEKLRLDFKFWSDELTLDIYFACIDVNIDDRLIRATVVREVYTQNKGTGVFVGLIDFYKDIGKVVLANDIPGPSLLGPIVARTLDQTNSQENDGLSIVDGTELFKPGIEELIIKIYLNLGSEIEKDFYYRKILELGDWDFKFKKSQKYVNTKQKMNKDFKNVLNEVPLKSQIATVEVNTSSRASDPDSYTSPLIPNLPTFEVPHDFTQFNAKPKPDRISGESLSSFYKRWYESSI